MTMIRMILTCLIVGLATLSVRAQEVIVSFTFDDVPKSVIEVGVPILDGAGFPATIYVTTGNTIYPGYMNWDDIALVAQKGWEVGMHTHKHGDFTKMSDVEILDDLLIATQLLALHGYSPTTFASPFGNYDDRVLSILQRYYTSHRTAWPDGINGGDVDPYRIASFAIDRDTTFAEITEAFTDLQNRGGWIVLQLHHLFSKGEVVTEAYGTNLLYDIVEYVRAEGYTVLTVSDALQRLEKGG